LTSRHSCARETTAADGKLCPASGAKQQSFSRLLKTACRWVGHTIPCVAKSCCTHSIAPRLSPDPPIPLGHGSWQAQMWLLRHRPSRFGVSRIFQLLVLSFRRDSTLLTAPLPFRATNQCGCWISLQRLKYTDQQTASAYSAGVRASYSCVHLIIVRVSS
jgi:hypothetical protein